MNDILDDALLGLLLLRKGIHLNNDSEDRCKTPSYNDGSHTSNDSNATHTSYDSSMTPTSSLKKKKRKYKKRGSTSFYLKKGTMNPVSRISGVGKGIEKSLKDNNIMNVADLRGLDPQTMKI